eukprot:2163431-Amphidinium_carterae.1
MQNGVEDPQAIELLQQAPGACHLHDSRVPCHRPLSWGRVGLVQRAAASFDPKVAGTVPSEHPGGPWQTKVLAPNVSHKRGSP